MNNSEKKTKMIHGGRNLIILGISAAVIALTTTSVSLYIYRVTGDIYLDRSRPGFISKDEKHEDDTKTSEEFSSEGGVDTSSLQKYLEQLNSVNERINAHDSDFSGEQLSDDALGIYVESDDSETE